MRLLVVEDEPDLVTALAKGLRREGYAVDTASDGEEADILLQINDYDLLVLDLNLPGLDGLEVARRARTRQLPLLILMLTARVDCHDRVTGLDSGADDYLVKPFHWEELSARIRALLRRDLRTRDVVLQCGDLKLDPGGRVAWQGNKRLKLTRTEFGILHYLMCHPGEVVSQEALVEHVWDENVNPFTASVPVHIHSLRRKLGDAAQHPRYIATVSAQGYQMVCVSGKHGEE